ncbi:Mrp family chromosome partitioning ATPase [Rhodopirellula rubra]|uniref:Mrp family chromosome partitioning ATPase n=1 Tax=Aporhodopirellula rubra TaxID=980271 RepID=A0A7W5DYS5_9BACT|nr:AAA family ATPase [Aporhodopirellula rubra]MBB3206704.1 Mrp family chromosome partitioning ATPase [Aporhodopirellula rubra]
MPHANEPTRATGDAHVPQQTATAVHPRSLRERIGQENMTQSSVLASRRLDEALLRLDRAAGRNRTQESQAPVARPTQAVAYSNRVAMAPLTGDSITGDSVSGDSFQQDAAAMGAGALNVERDLYDEDFQSPQRMHRAGLEFDHSVSQSSSMWLENEETAQQIRLDTAHPSPQSAPHFAPRMNPEPVAEHPPVDTRPPVAGPAEPVEANRVSEEQTSISADALEAMFAQPIDVMILSTTARITDNEVKEPIPAPEQTRLHQADNSASQSAVAAPVQPAPVVSAVEPAAVVVATEVPVKPEVAAEQPVAAPPQTTAPPQTATQPESATQLEPAAEPQPVTPPVVETEPEPARQPAPLAEFTPAWQVDEFIVPATIDELFLSGSIAEQLSARLAKAREQGLRTISITSTKPGEGRSTVAIGLALSVAFSGLRVALVDADREGVKIATDLHLDLDHSWPDAIRGNTPLEEIAVASDADALTLLPLLERNGEAPFQSEELREMLVRLQKSFDIVIVDCGPSSIADSVLCDTALIVRDMQRTKALEVETLALSLRRNGLSGVGVIENFC